MTRQNGYLFEISAAIPCPAFAIKCSNCFNGAMTISNSQRRTLATLPWLAGAMGLGLFVFHLLVNRQYGFHGDELYFIVCGNRPAWGYVDHPPFVPMLARLATDLMGVNLFALRFFPALVLGVCCVLTGWLARRLGSGRFGEFLAALSFVFTPMFLRTGAFLNIPCFEILFWLVIAHLLVTLCRCDDARWWLAVGAVAGLALLNKHTTLFLGSGIAAGIILTRRRKDLLTPWPYAGAAIAFLVFLPNLLWQIHHDWATLEFVRNLNATEMQDTPRPLFVVGQFILMNVFNAVVWIAGLVFFLKSAPGRPYRILGWIYLTVFVIMLTFKAKVYYLAPAYPMLLAGGAVLLEQQISRRPYLRASLPTAIAAMGIVFIPIVCPIGSIEWKEQYISRVLGFMLDDPSDLTFDFRYQILKQDQLDAFLNVYNCLPVTEQADCVVLAKDYGCASLVNVLGRDAGLPPGISGNNSYYLWGPQGATGRCV
ncbi:MAG: glycosyltransferase family 39 protein, partial [Candidatus Hydrogenedentes bacterium]|nr:glycosyltransferase family 39 protein [Candidatus Hydrogenedentota bacterium]